jgi:hypothetical protein
MHQVGQKQKAKHSQEQGQPGAVTEPQASQIQDEVAAA